MARLALLLLCVLGPAIAGAEASLQLEDCRISAGEGFRSIKARCAAFARPVDPEEPVGNSIELRVAVVPALSLTPEPEPFVPLAGGPGQGAIQFYATWASAFELVRRDRDILLVDQRGTGESARMDCPIDDTVVEGQFGIAQTIEYTERCLDQLPHDPRFFTTSVAVRDLDAVREALGYPALNLYGVSYGSRVAQHYARTFPQTTRSVVLDGVVPPQIPLGPEIAIESQRAIEDVIARCAGDDACNERFPELAEDFAFVRDRLESEPVIVELQDPSTGRVESIDFGREQFNAAIRLLAYQATTIALLPLVISDAANGNFIPLAAQYQLTASDLSDSLALGMHNAVMCSEDAPFIDGFDIDHDAIAASYIGPLQLEAIETMCSIWPKGPVDETLHEPLATDLPVLLLSGDADPITPPRYAELAAESLRNSRHIIGQDQGHGQASVGCVPRLLADFVETLDLESLDAGCTERSFVMPFFLDFSGPLP
ncbi:MAG: alpha/beta hydrolase [Woeseiaceae bacterium]|nr:alpha/beta hydrolase [Woeseiaceae bacterium]